MKYMIFKLKLLKYNIIVYSPTNDNTLLKHGKVFLQKLIKSKLFNFKIEIIKIKYNKTK